MVAKTLIQERRVFDLTPGGDKYKDQLATGHEATHTLFFFPSLSAAIEYRHTRDLAEKAVKKLVRIVVKRPARALMASFSWRKRDGKRHPREPEIRFRLHTLNAVHCGISDERLHAVRNNKIADLVRYEPTHAQSLRDFVSEARGFIDQGADVYTLVRNGRLMASCWIMPGERAPSVESANSGVPAGTALVVGFYAHASEDAPKC